MTLTLGLAKTLHSLKLKFCQTETNGTLFFHVLQMFRRFHYLEAFGESDRAMHLLATKNKFHFSAPFFVNWCQKAEQIHRFNTWLFQFTTFKRACKLMLAACVGETLYKSNIEMFQIICPPGPP